MTRIETSFCDTCSDREASGTMYSMEDGSDVLFQCKACNPEAYAAAAERQITAWLAGGD